MAFGHGKDTEVFFNGYTLSSYLQSHSSTEEIDMAETSTFGTSAKTYVSGMRDATLSLEGLFDGAASAVDEVLKAALQQNNKLFVICPQGATISNACFGFSANVSTYEVSGDTGDVVSLSMEAQSTVGREHILSHHAMTTEVATGNGTSVDGTAATTNGAISYCQVPDITGITSLALKWQDSADNSVWADIAGGAFTAVTADRSAQRLAIAGTIRRYTRLVWTFTGAGSAQFYAGLGRL